MKIDENLLANYLRGCAFNYVFETPELEDKDIFDLMAIHVQAFLRENPDGMQTHAN